MHPSDDAPHGTGHSPHPPPHQHPSPTRSHRTHLIFQPAVGTASSVRTTGELVESGCISTTPFASRLSDSAIQGTTTSRLICTQSANEEIHTYCMPSSGGELGIGPSMLYGYLHVVCYCCCMVGPTVCPGIRKQLRDISGCNGNATFVHSTRDCNVQPCRRVHLLKVFSN